MIHKHEDWYIYKISQCRFIRVADNSPAVYIGTREVVSEEAAEQRGKHPIFIELIFRLFTGTNDANLTYDVSGHTALFSTLKRIGIFKVNETAKNFFECRKNRMNFMERLNGVLFKAKITSKKKPAGELAFQFSELKPMDHRRRADKRSNWSNQQDKSSEVNLVKMIMVAPEEKGSHDLGTLTIHGLCSKCSIPLIFISKRSQWSIRKNVITIPMECPKCKDGYSFSLDHTGVKRSDKKSANKKVEESVNS